MRWSAYHERLLPETRLGIHRTLTNPPVFAPSRPTFSMVFRLFTAKAIRSKSCCPDLACPRHAFVEHILFVGSFMFFFFLYVNAIIRDKGVVLVFVSFQRNNNCLQQYNKKKRANGKNNPVPQTQRHALICTSMKIPKINSGILD